jgi:hypothetical protein
VLSADGRHCRPFFLSGAGALKSSPTLAQHDPVPRNRAGALETLRAKRAADTQAVRPPRIAAAAMGG